MILYFLAFYATFNCHFYIIFISTHPQISTPQAQYPLGVAMTISCLLQNSGARGFRAHIIILLSEKNCFTGSLSFAPPLKIY